MTATDKLLEIVKRKGPVVPSEVAKDIGQNLLFTSAMLSELKSRGHLLISNLKVGGGSPLYYTPDQQKDLVRFIKHLDQKDQRTAQKLEEKKVLRDTDESPLIRVSLREIKDFAVPLEVTFGDSMEIFWKWYLTPDQEASSIINSLINGSQIQIQPTQEDGLQHSLPESQQDVSQVNQKDEKAADQKVEELTMNEEEVKSAPVEKKKTQKVEKKETKTKHSEQEEQKQLVKIEKGQKKDESEFYEKIMNFLEEREIDVKSEKIIRKSKEFEFFLDVPSPVGKVEFFCIAKKKKSLSEGDISTMYVNGQSHNKPMLVITDGTLAKKAEDLLKKQIKGLNVQTI